jgi:hypothetical protein
LPSLVDIAGPGQSLDSSMGDETIESPATAEQADRTKRAAVHNLIELLLRGEMDPKQQLVCVRVLTEVIAESRASHSVLLRRKELLVGKLCASQVAQTKAGVNIGAQGVAGAHRCSRCAQVRTAVHRYAQVCTGPYA